MVIGKEAFRKSEASGKWQTEEVGEWMKNRNRRCFSKSADFRKKEKEKQEKYRKHLFYRSSIHG